MTRPHGVPAGRPVPLPPVPGHPGLTRLVSSRADHPVFFCAYHGESMSPLLRECDVLEVEPGDGARVQVGDVVLLDPPGSEQLVVHRVIGRTPAGVRTRGDNCPAPDRWELAPDQVLGTVVAARRGQAVFAIHRGDAGLQQARDTRRRRAFTHRLAKVSRPLFSFAMQTAGLRHLLPRSLRPRIVTFRAAGETRRRLMLGRHAVGWHEPEGDRWHVRFPFAMLVAPGLLAPCAFQSPDREVRLLLDVCCTALTGKDSPSATDLPDIDWTRLTCLAGNHRVTILFCRGLQCGPWEHVPDTVRQRLRRAALENTAHGLQVATELFHVADLLARCGIPFVPVKGPLLALSAYGDPCGRISGDVDILVRPEDMQRARQALVDGGYATTLELPPAAETAYLRERGEYYLVGPGDAGHVDLMSLIVPRLFACRVD